jgi:ribosomal protein L36
LTSATAEAFEAKQRANRAAPGPDDLRKEVKARIEYKKDGDWVAHVPPEHAKRAFQMMNGSRKVKNERGELVKSRQDKERLVRRDGRVIEVNADNVDLLKKKGLRPTGRNGRSAALYFSMSEAAERYVRGPDGLDFVWSDGWEPAPLFTPRVESPQRDPDGNVWVKQGSEWVLDDEVE